MRTLLRLAIVATAVLACSACTPDNSAEIERVKAEARAKHPNDPVAAEKAGNDAIFRHLEQQKLSQTPEQIAAQVFLGYYTKYFYGLPAVCAEQGVKLQAFPQAFATVSRSPYEAARHLVNATDIIEHVRPSSANSARPELIRLSQSANTSLADACAFIETNASSSAEGLAGC